MTDVSTHEHAAERPLINDQGAASDQIAVPPTSDPLLRMLEQTLTNPELDVEKLERLYALYEQSQARKAEIAFKDDLARMQAELPVISELGAITNKEKQKQSGYAFWSDIKEAIKPVMGKYGFGISHRTTQGEGGITVTGILSHRLGHQEETSLTLQHDSTGSKNAVQAVGSSVAYGTRYTAKELIGFTTKDDNADDDGTAADAKVITEEQQELLKILCIDAEIEVGKFLGHYGHTAFNQIPANAFIKVKGSLEARAVAMQAKRKKEASEK